MGVVYKAEDTRLERIVALKFLPPELTRDEDAKKRFVQEARAASALDHPNICNVHDIEETPEGQSFICMACYDGETLKKRIERGPLPAREAVRIVSSIASGLAEAHKHGIIHRDIKPANVMVTNDGDVKTHLGIEFEYADLFALRAGYRMGWDNQNISVGFGAKIRGIRIDYAYVPYYSDLGDTHRISLGFLL